MSANKIFVTGSTGFIGYHLTKSLFDDVHESFANIKKSRKMLNYNPTTDIQDGVARFIDWHKAYHKTQ